MKYIFLIGAPGSGWSDIPFFIYPSPDIDRTDCNDQRMHCRLDSHGKRKTNHLGSYFDPGMEFGNWFDRLDQHTQAECEAEFDRPFSGTGARIIRSHVFAYHIDFIRKTWPDCPIILVHRADDICVEWWFRSGGFDINYPSYRGYYKDRETMTARIWEQNAGISKAWVHYEGQLPANNFELCDILGIAHPPAEHFDVYNTKRPDLPFVINVKVI